MTQTSPTDSASFGALPAEWEVYPFWSVTHRRKETQRTELDLLSVYLDRGVIPYSEGGGLVHKPSLDLSGYQAVYAGDLVMNNQQAWRGSVGVSAFEGIVSPAYLVFQVHSKLDPVYANYLFRSSPMVDQFVLASKGVGSIQRQIDKNTLRTTQVPVPTLTEQQRFAEYLEAVSRYVSSAVGFQMRLISLLEEERQAVITQAVTKGLDAAPVVDSDVTWLGEIPQAWDLVPARAVLKRVRRSVGARSGDYELLSLTLRGVIPRDLEGMKGKFPASFDTYQIVEPGDFVFCLFDVDETPRTVGLAKYSGMITGAYDVFRSTGVNPEYLYYQFLAFDMQKSLKPLYRGLRKTIPSERFASMWIALPPPDEQAAIVAEVKTQVQRIDEAIRVSQQQIDLLEEYRTRLIADVVTGKLDVRELAGGVPDMDLGAKAVEEIEDVTGVEESIA